MKQLPSDLILHLFDFLIIPPKDFISIFLLNKYWKENTLDNFTFWERQLLNLLFIYCKEQLLIENTVDIYLFYKNYKKLNLQNVAFFKNIVKNENCKVKFLKVYNYMVTTQFLQKINKRKCCNFYNYFNVSITKFKKLFLQEKNIDSITIVKYTNYLVNNYKNSTINETDYNNGLNIIFIDTVLQNDLKFFENKYSGQKLLNSKLVIINLINCYFKKNNESEHQLILDKIIYILQNLLLQKNHFFIYNYIFKKYCKELYNYPPYYRNNNFTIDAINFLQFYSTLYQKHRISEKTVNILEKNKKGISYYIFNLFSSMGEKKYEFIDFLVNHFNFDISFYKGIFCNAVDDKEFIVNILKSLANRNKKLIKLKDLIKFESTSIIAILLSVWNFDLFKEGFNYLYKLICKENYTTNEEICKKKLLKTIIKHFEIYYLLKSKDETIFLKLNYLKELFLNSNLYKLFKRTVFQQFITNLFFNSNTITIKCIDYFIKEWNLNLNDNFSKTSVTAEYMIKTLQLEKKHENINNIINEKRNLQCIFPIIIYDVHLLLMESTYYYTSTSKEDFYEIINYLKDNQLFDFYKRLHIAEIDCNDSLTNYDKKEYITELQKTIVWKEITTMDLINKVEKYNQWE
ncbi:hypothetical protein ABK040_008754 [Willaertia magna]